MQTITIAGRIGRDAELRSTQNGDQVCNFSVAVETRQGREKVTNWWRVSLWGKRGEALTPYLTKGSAVAVIGGFELGEYDGKPQLNVRASEVTLLGSPQQDERRRSADSDRQQARQRSQDNGGGGWGNSGNSQGWRSTGDDLDDEVPF